MGRREALRNGALTHVLLQYLPNLSPEHRREAAQAFLAARADDLDAQARDFIAEAALGVIELPSLADLFAPGSQAEVRVAGKVLLPRGGIAEVTGQVDRIGEGYDEVLVADYKTGAPRGLADFPGLPGSNGALSRRFGAARPTKADTHAADLDVGAAGRDA